MATPSEKLARSLDVLRALQGRGVIAIHTRDLTRTHRERLLANGFLQKVMRGWYLPSRPDEVARDSTAWYASFWSFCAAYLGERFGLSWCLSPEQSLSLHAGNRTVPRQLLVRSPRARNKVTGLPYGTSLLDVRSAIPDTGNVEDIDGLRVFSLATALVACSAGFFRRNATDTRVALSLVQDSSEVLVRLLDGGHSSIAGRLAGAFRNVGHDRIANEIVRSMRAAGYCVREHDPFEAETPLVLTCREMSPHVKRIRLMWRAMREPVIACFPQAPGMPRSVEDYMRTVEDGYVTDAYHSLSIEGYRVSPELIDRVRAGAWKPQTDSADRNQLDALAARGYWQAFQEVQGSIERVLRNENPGIVVDEDHGTWYLEMFSPSVAAGLLRPSDLAGYRNDQVYIRSSMHVPPRCQAVRDLMPSLFELLREETEPSVRVVLGHFMFVYIHPYMDGNGRIARFVMNVMLAASGYPWTAIPLGTRAAYMDALEDAAVRQNISPFVDFLGSLVGARLRGEITLDFQLPE